MYIIDVSPEIIRAVVEEYGLPVRLYQCEQMFKKYVEARLPARYAQWRDQHRGCRWLLSDWSTNKMMGLITKEEHDRILADFCNSAVRPNEQIQELLDGMK